MEECNDIDVKYLCDDINDKEILYYKSNLNTDVEVEFCDSYYKEYIKKIKDKHQKMEYYTYSFECPNINNLKIKEEKDIIYDKILNQFEEQLKEWLT